MRLFGTVTDDERRLWQRRGLVALTRIIDLATVAKLPPILWTLTGPGIQGQVGPYFDEEHDQHAVWREWVSALCGLCGEPEFDRRTLDRDGTTMRYAAKFVLCLNDQDWPRCDVVLGAVVDQEAGASERW